MDKNRPLLTMTLEDVAALDDETLAKAGSLIREEIATLRTRSEWIDGEVLRRIGSRGPSATRLMVPGMKAEVKSTTTYEWNAERAEEILRPHATPEELARAIKRKPAEPVREKVTVQTQAALALARAAGIESELEAAYSKKQGAPTVEYTPVAEAPDPGEMEFE